MINRVLFYNSGGGIGDAIQILPLINSVKKQFTGADFFYLCSHENHFKTNLKDLNCDIETLNLNIKYFGFRWWHYFNVRKKVKKLKIGKFDLIIDLQTKIRNTLILKKIPHDYFISACFNFLLSKPKISINKENLNNQTIIKAINRSFKVNCVLQEYNINNINNKFFIEAKRLLPEKNYVGLSITQGNVYRKKEWPLENLIDFCAHLKKNNKIPVFFIEKKKIKLKEKIQNLIPNSIFPEHKSSISSPALVVCLSKRLDFALSIDNGIMHMLSLGKIPMIVLFGPTNSQKFAPTYENCTVIDSKKIYKTNDISKITSQDVLSASRQFLNF